MVWSGSQKAYCVEVYLKTGSIIMTMRAFRSKFKVPPTSSLPSRNSILLWASNFKQLGSTQKKKAGGHESSARTPEKIDAMKTSVDQFPNRSARKHALTLKISDRSARRILKFDLKMHPYKILVTQKLSETDYSTRKRLCLEMKQKISPTDTVFFSDEAHFHLCGAVNRQNLRYWDVKNPQVVRERPLHSPKVTVWCAISESEIWGPYFFEDNDVTVTVDTNRYCQMLEDVVRPKLDDMNNAVFFQQDGATCHTSSRSMTLLRELFPQKLISLRGDIGWPARSPDLNPCDFFLWGFLKSRVFSDSYENLAQLKRAIRREVALITPSMLHEVRRNFHKRLDSCVVNNGAHMADIIFKT
jgi:inhibitor of nuclear factor kappa-B kinase subunit alpha